MIASSVGHENKCANIEFLLSKPSVCEDARARGAFLANLHEGGFVAKAKSRFRNSTSPQRIGRGPSTSS